jgi:AcrR family transcriptional regulator
MYDVSSPEDLLWVRPEPGERRPAHTRESIAAAALKIADTQGFEAVTMRNVAAELGAGTMTLYHYVRNKTELTALMAETIMGELVIPDGELPQGWREGLGEIARRTLRIFTRHSWVVDHMDDDGQAPWGPNALRHVEQSLAVAARTGLGVDEQLELTGLIDEYVFGYAYRNREHESERRHLQAMVVYLETQLKTGEFPHLAAIAGDNPRGWIEHVIDMANDEARFERGLQRLLDGVALDLERRGLA